VTNSPGKPDPSTPVFYETSKYPPEPKPKPQADRPATPAPRYVDAKKPADEPPKSKFAALNEIARDEIEDIHDISEGVTDTVKQVLDPPNPTGQHVGTRPDQGSGQNPFGQPDAHDSGLGTGLAAMLCTGLFVGEAARLTYRKVAEVREGRHARN